MKIEQAHYDHIKQALAPHAADLQAHRKSLKGDYRIKDVEKRLRWDASFRYVGSRWVCDTLYSYLDDTHIDTALRSVFRELGI